MINPIKVRPGDNTWFDYKRYYTYIAGILPQSGNIIELGVYHGDSIVWLASELRRYGKQHKIYAIDNWQDFDCAGTIFYGGDTHRRFIQNIHENCLENTIIILTGDRSLCNIMKYNSIDFAFIDANHTEENVHQDIQHLWPKIKIGGIIAGHDYFACEGVKKVVDNSFPTAIKFKTYQDKGLWHVKRNNKRLGIMFPYRNREDNLYTIAPLIHSYLTERGFDFKIYLVEQSDKKEFNRGKLFNAGYSLTKDEYDYFVCHDIDMFPVDVDYSESEVPVHMATDCSIHNFKLPYDSYYGGVTLFPNQCFESINGFSNEFWGWGSEDDDLYNRVVAADLPIVRRQCTFECPEHDRTNNYIRKTNLDLLAAKRFSSGLSNLKFDLVSREEEFLYSHIKVDL